MTLNIETLYIRELRRANSRRGVIVQIGLETRSQQELVEKGHLWQEIHDARHYKFTLSPSGRRILNKAEESSAPVSSPLTTERNDA